MKKLWSVFTDNMDKCIFTGSWVVERHHIFGGSNRKKSEKYGLLIPICNECHREVHDAPDQELNKKLKANAQADFMMDHTYAEWMKQFDRNYM